MRWGFQAARALVFALLVLVPVAARADDALPTRQASLAFDEKQTLRVSIGYRDVVDAATVAKLMGGLPTTIVMRAYVFREAGGAPLAAAFKTCRVIFDLWDEVYRIEISQTGGADAVTASPTLEGVLRRCAEADRLAIIGRNVLPAGTSYYMAGVVEVNPVSPEMLERIKRWVSRPSGTSTSAPGDALFGSFVGLFVARIGVADRQIAFRTQPFSR
ncbi:MAG TPA: hypothetical protein VK550_21260 [Polyangiaceae bacterium]|nr:hypothetical protein [Polyangiaceae bacterium]